MARFGEVLKGVSKNSQMEPRGATEGGGRSLVFGSFRLDLAEQQLSLEGEPVALTPKAYETLVALVERAGRVVGKTELLELVWPGTFVEEATLTQNIYTLRKALGGGTGTGEPLIETVPRRGYRFTAEVRVEEALPEAGAEERLGSLAVLPFRTLGDRDTDELLVLGMADALITRLSGLRQLAVRPTSAITRYVGGAAEPLGAGRALEVDGVLEGTVQRAGDRLRVTIQLVRVRDGACLYGETLDTIYDDIFTVQDTISRRIVETLKLRLTRREEERLTRSATVDPESYESYIRGRFHWNKRTRENLEKAISWFQRAVALDGTSALAFAGLADSYVLLPLYGDTPPTEVFPRAREAASRAIGLDGDLAEAHTSLAYTRFVHDWEWQEAEESFRRALALNGNYATGHHWYGFMLAALGRHEEALEHAEQALRLDPLSLVIGADLGFVLYFSRRFEEAVERFRQTLELDPAFAYGHFGSAMALVALGKTEEAVEEAAQATRFAGRRSAMVAALGFALARAGRSKEARDLLEEIQRAGSQAPQPVQASRAALVLAGLGDDEATLDELEKACEQRSRFSVFMGVWPVFDDLRRRRRFQRLLDRVGLPTSG